MRIFIREKGKLPIFLLLPNGLILNSFSARIAVKAAGRYAPDSLGDMTAEELSQFMGVLKQSAKLLSGQPLVQLEDHEGTRLTLWL